MKNPGKAKRIQRRMASSARRSLDRRLATANRKRKGSTAYYALRNRRKRARKGRA